jgi:sugar lactone lactonase YvrE
MTHRRVIAALLVTVGALACAAPPALADPGRGLGPTPFFTLAERVGISDGNPEGVAFDRRTGLVLVSRTATGAIYAGPLADLATAVDPGPMLQPFIPGSPPREDGMAQAAGLKVREGRLYVAGGGTGQVRVYDIASRALLATFDTRGADTASPTFVNDLVVTADGDIYATDSFRPFIYRIDGRAVAAGAGAVEAIDVSARIPYVAGAFNLNGIVEDDGDLVVVQSATGELFRVQPGDDAPPAAGIREIPVRGGPLTGGDGLLIDRGRLLVVQGAAPGFPKGVVTVVRLRERRAAVERRIADETLAGPSTIARARDRWLVVNANFGGGPPFTVSALPRGHDEDD